MNQKGMSPKELAALIEASNKFAAIVCIACLAIDACIYDELNSWEYETRIESPRSKSESLKGSNGTIWYIPARRRGGIGISWGGSGTREI